MATVHLGLGSNMGDREANIAAACRGLAELPGTAFVTRSSLYETAPVGGPPGQGDFYNAVCAVETRLGPAGFLRETQALERRIGRLRETETARWGPRVIDIDILLWGGRAVEEPGLSVPHPRLAERAFVLVPLAEIAGGTGLRHPLTGQTVGELVEKLNRGEREGIRRLSL
jgi:2-amino-4-hydroxy-6-hydroxymethyldihydropteridine diphosphokinase